MTLLASQITSSPQKIRRRIIRRPAIDLCLGLVTTLLALGFSSMGALAHEGKDMRTSKIWSPEIVEKQGLAPDMSDPATRGQLYNIWMAGKEGDHSLSILVQMKAGQRSGPHLHTDSTHYTCSLRGDTLLWVEGEMKRVKPGECFTVPSGLLHDIGADTTNDAWFMETTSPSGTMVYLKDTDRKNVVRIEAQVESDFQKAYTK